MATEKLPGQEGAVKGVDRLPPHSIEGEQGILACILLDPKESMMRCLDRIADGGKVFYDNRHVMIYDALFSLWEMDRLEMEKIGETRAEFLFQVQTELKDRKKYDEIGGLEYLELLMDFAPHSGNIDIYLDVVIQKSVLRQIIEFGTTVVSKVYEKENTPHSELIDEIESDVLKICQERVVSVTQAPIKELVHKAINQIEELHQAGGTVKMPWGFPELDKMTGGLRVGMNVIAARPSMGKTSIAMNVAEVLAVDNNVPVGVFSLEMTSVDLTLRMICSRGRVNLHNVGQGFLKERDFTKLTKSAGMISKAPLYIDDTPALSINQLRAKARRMKTEYGIELLVIDYLQLLHCIGRRYDNNRQQEIADISSGIKALSKELDVPVIILCQLNRDIEKEKSRKPRLSDLRESGAIEQDADLVGILYKAQSEDNEQQDIGNEGESMNVNLLICKQRNGPTGDVRLKFLRSFTRMESRIDIDDNDIPQQRGEKQNDDLL
jgi:replicative DNA helicase